MVEEPPHVKQLSLNQVCKIGLKKKSKYRICYTETRRRKYEYLLWDMKFTSMKRAHAYT